MSAPRSPRRRVYAFAALWLAISAAVLLVPGCYGRNCEGGFETFGDDPGEGMMLDENTWVSGPLDGTWLWFPRQRTYIFDLKALGGRLPDLPLAFISGTPDPAKFGNNMTLAAGNLAQMYSLRPNGLDLKNESCSDYYLRLVVQAAPFPPEAPEQDGGDADAGTDDASAGDDDAASDAGDDDAEAGP